MMKLLTNARLTEVSDTAGRFLTLHATVPAATNPYLLTLVAELQARYAQITEAIRRDKAHSDLEEADELRGTKVSNFFKVVDGAAANEIPALREAGLRLQAVLGRYGLHIIHENYTAESGFIEAMLLDLSADDLKASVLAIQGAKEGIAAIRAAQDNFNAKRVAYEKAAATDRQTETASTLKAPLLQLINEKYLPQLAALRNSDPADYAAYADAAEKITEDTNAAIKLRATLAKKKKDEGK